MKKNYLLLLMLFVSMALMAGPVTPDEAIHRIASFMGSHRAGSISSAGGHFKLVATSHYQESPDVAVPSFYIFNVGEGQGYVIAAADDRVPAVLGYSDSGTFDPQHMPANMQAWLDGYNDQMEYLSRHPEAAARKVVSGDEIFPLLESEWNQGDPYNLLCPIDEDDKHSVTGCVATAMAQLMYYWKYPSQTTAEIPGYTSEKKGFELPAIPAGTPIDWENMLPKYTGEETDRQRQAVAELMLMCGTTLRMDYSSKSSSAASSNVPNALLSYLDYDAATCYKNRVNYRLAEWNQMVYDELKARRPVLYAGQSSGGGHSFIIDGYGGDDYFHVNWGWGGGSNDYFLLSILESHNNSGIGASSSTDGYSYDQGAVFGAQPNTGVLPPAPLPLLNTNRVGLVGDAKLTRESTAENFSIVVSADYWNSTGETHKFEFGYAVYDSDGKQLVLVPSVWTYDLETGTGYSFGKLKFTFTFGAGATSGTWIIKPVCRPDDSETWYANKGTETNYLTVTINENTLTVVEPHFGLKGTLQATGKTEALTTLPLLAAIVNDGTFYNGQIFLLVDGNVTLGRHFDIDAGETANLDLSFIPKEAGEKVIELCTRSWNGKDYEYTPFISGTVTIAPAPAFSLKMTPSTKNAVREDGKDVVKDSKAIFRIKVENTGSNDYDKDVIVRLYKYIDEKTGTLAGTASKTIQLAAGASTNVELQIDGLENGARYFYYVLYVSEGKETKGYQYSPSFTVSLPDGIQQLMHETGDEAVAVYALNGRKVTEARGTALKDVMATLPKGVYIVRCGDKSLTVTR